MVWAHKGSDEQAFTTTQNVRFWHKATFGLVVRWLQLLVGSSATSGKERLQLGGKLNAIYQFVVFSDVWPAKTIIDISLGQQDFLDKVARQVRVICYGSIHLSLNLRVFHANINAVVSIKLD